MVKHPPALLGAWGLLTIGLAIKAFAGGLLGPGDSGVQWRPHRIDINRAGLEELALLPGVGPARAEAIILERVRHGPFRSLPDLARVEGCGPQLRVSVEPHLQWSAAVEGSGGAVEASMGAVR